MASLAKTHTFPAPRPQYDLENENRFRRTLQGSLDDLSAAVGSLDFTTVPAHEHFASQIGGSTDAERTFKESGKYTFPGNLHVAGTFTFGATMLPAATNLYDIGSTSFRVRDTYQRIANLTGALNFSGSAFHEINATDGTSVLTITAANELVLKRTPTDPGWSLGFSANSAFRPKTNGLQDIGSTTLRVRKLWVNDIDMAGTFTGITASEVGGDNDAERTFEDAGMYTFQGLLKATSALLVGDGTNATPSVRFTNDPDNGLYLTPTLGANVWSMAAGGSRRMSISAPSVTRPAVEITGTITGTSPGALRINPTINASSSGQTLRALLVDPIFGNSGAHAATTVIGMAFAPQFGSGGAQTIATARSLEVGGVTNGAVTLTKWQGAYFPGAPVGVAGGTDFYALYVENVAGATNNYAIYTNAGLVRFGDTLLVDEIGEVTGAAGVTVDGVLLKDGGATLSGRLTLTSTSDVSLAGVSGALIVGGDGTGAHIAIDGDEIQSKATATTAGALSLQALGGDVIVGTDPGGSGTLRVGGFARFGADIFVGNASNENVHVNPTGAIGDNNRILFTNSRAEFGYDGAVGPGSAIVRSGGGKDIAFYPNATLTHVMKSSGALLVGTTTAATGNPRLDVVQGAATYLTITGADNIADATLKRGGFGVRHYTNAEEPFALIAGFSDATVNTVRIGASLSGLNSATSIHFYTAANNTTIAGTLAADLTGVGTSSLLHLRGDLRVGSALDHDGTTVGFYGTTPVAQQTGVAVTAAAIHAALVNLGLITA